jgi:hypothetical protein
VAELVLIHYSTFRRDRFIAQIKMRPIAKIATVAVNVPVMAGILVLLASGSRDCIWTLVMTPRLAQQDARATDHSPWMPRTIDTQEEMLNPDHFPFFGANRVSERRGVPLT